MALYGKNPKGFIRAKEAARRLGLSLPTVKAWVRDGLLEGKYRMMTPDGPITLVRESTLSRDFDVTCVQCGRHFSTRQPKRTLVCSKKCENDRLRGKRPSNPRGQSGRRGRSP
jgi:hypothetical protein